MAKRAANKSDEPEWIVYVIRGKRPADRLGAVTAPDSAATIAKAVGTFSGNAA
jgi:hypothetical protein